MSTAQTIIVSFLSFTNLESPLSACSDSHFTLTLRNVTFSKHIDSCLLSKIFQTINRPLLRGVSQSEVFRQGALLMWQCTDTFFSAPGAQACAFQQTKRAFPQTSP